MRVLVADDSALFRDGIISLLKAAGLEVVGQAGDGDAAVKAASQLHPDLILLDIQMPKMNGLEALRLIKSSMPEIQVVMLTVSEEDADLFEAAKAGAEGYLLKSLNADEFLDMLDGLQRGEAAMTRQTTARLMKRFTQAAATPPAPAQRLTDREVELLKLVAAGMANKAIAQQLSISENTVKYHMKKIMQKLNVQNRTEAVTQSIRAGLLDPSSFNDSHDIYRDEN